MQYIEKLVLVTQVYSNNWKKSREKTFADPVQKQGEKEEEKNTGNCKTFYKTCKRNKIINCHSNMYK